MRADVFDDSRYYTGPDLTEALVAEAEAGLGFRLPASYLELLRVRNGGTPRKKCFRTEFATSWASNHFEIAGIRGIGGAWGIDGSGPLSSSGLIKEWGYPEIGIVVCDMPSGGHDALMLDYRDGSTEPAVAYVDEDRVPRVVARTFADFVDGLESADAIDVR